MASELTREQAAELARDRLSAGPPAVTEETHIKE